MHAKRIGVLTLHQLINEILR